MRQKNLLHQIGWKLEIQIKTCFLAIHAVFLHMKMPIIKAFQAEKRRFNANAAIVEEYF